jgi:polyribonucleotide nucleotidyltransferase
MDAGVPIKAPVAGISAGLVTNEEDEDDFITFMDIQGIEDFFGDMDFKVAGTEKGITAIQVDIKVQGLSYEVIRQAFELTRKGRMQILNEIILPCIEAPRSSVSKYAPKMFTMQINPDKIRDVIGSGGKTINKIIDETGVKIDIDETGKIFIACIEEENAKRAMKIIDGITGNLEVGEVFEGKVTRIMAFGAFVEFLPGQEGLVHISKLAKFRVEKVEDVVREGDIVKVKFIGYDKMGRLDLSIKDV